MVIAYVSLSISTYIYIYMYVSVYIEVFDNAAAFQFIDGPRCRNKTIICVVGTNAVFARNSLETP